jgi:hypothetical protein
MPHRRGCDLLLLNGGYVSAFDIHQKEEASNVADLYWELAVEIA